MWPILRVYNVEETRQREFRRLLVSAIAWLRQLPDLVDARAFKCQDAPPHFYSWVAWKSLSARDRALQSALWPRIMSTIQPTLTGEPAVYILEVIFSRNPKVPPHDPAALAVMRCAPGAPDAGREAVVKYGQEVAETLGSPSVVLGQSVEDRATFVGLFDLVGPAPEPLPGRGALKSVQWCLLDPVQ